MVTFDFTGLLVVAVVAFLAPIGGQSRAPSARSRRSVLEVLLGVAVGPQGLGWVQRAVVPSSSST